jgi:hypothetical protein
MDTHSTPKTVDVASLPLAGALIRVREGLHEAIEGAKESPESATPETLLLMIRVALKRLDEVRDVHPAAKRSPAKRKAKRSR